MEDFFAYESDASLSPPPWLDGVLGIRRTSIMEFPPLKMDPAPGHEVLHLPSLVYTPLPWDLPPLQPVLPSLSPTPTQTPPSLVEAAEELVQKAEQTLVIYQNKVANRICRRSKADQSKMIRQLVEQLEATKKYLVEVRGW